MQPLLDAPPAVHPYAPGTWGPAAGERHHRRDRRVAHALAADLSRACRAVPETGRWTGGRLGRPGYRLRRAGEETGFPGRARPTQPRRRDDRGSRSDSGLRWGLPSCRERHCSTACSATEEPVIARRRPAGLREDDAAGRSGRERRGSRVAWVSCDQIDDDPGSLWPAVKAALGLDDRGPMPRRCPAGATATRRRPPDQTVGRDRAGHRRPRSPRGPVQPRVPAVRRRLRRGRAGGMDAGAGVAAKSCRSPSARMRVERRLLEIGADDLAMSGAEATRLLAAAGVELSRRDGPPRARTPRAGRRRCTWRPWRSGPARPRPTAGSRATTG